MVQHQCCHVYVNRYRWVRSHCAHVRSIIYLRVWAHVQVKPVIQQTRGPPKKRKDSGQQQQQQQDPLAKKGRQELGQQLITSRRPEEGEVYVCLCNGGK